MVYNQEVYKSQLFMKKYKNYQIALLALFCLAVNLCGKSFAQHFRLPLWLDSFGTILMAYVTGPFFGAVTGALSNVIYGFIDPVSFAYAITSVCIGLMVGYCARRGWMKSLFKTMSLSVMLTAACVLISTILNQVFYGGKTGNYWGDGIIEMLEFWGTSGWARALLGEFYVDFVDKVFTMGLLFFFIQFYRRIKKYLPKIFVLQKDTDDEKKTIDVTKMFALLLIAGYSF